MFSELGSISALSCSFEFVVWGVVGVGVGVGGSQRLLSLNPTTVMVVLLLGLWLLLGCDNYLCVHQNILNSSIILYFVVTLLIM